MCIYIYIYAYAHASAQKSRSRFVSCALPVGDMSQEEQSAACLEPRRPSKAAIAEGAIAVINDDPKLLLAIITRSQFFIQKGNVVEARRYNKDLINRIYDKCDGHQWTFNPTVVECAKALYDIDDHYMFKITGQDHSLQYCFDKLCMHLTPLPTGTTVSISFSKFP